MESNNQIIPREFEQYQRAIESGLSEEKIEELMQEGREEVREERAERMSERRERDN